jgi:hypothetical protein
VHAASRYGAEGLRVTYRHKHSTLQSVCRVRPLVALWLIATTLLFLLVAAVLRGVSPCPLRVTGAD